MGIRMVLVIQACVLICVISSQSVKPPKIYFLHVTSEIDYRFAKTVVTSKVVNKEPTASEAVFDLTLPNEAFITAFKLTINGKEIEGKVKEKEQAKQEFEAAKAKGQSAGHIVAKPRETNKFQIQVNVAAQEKVTFVLTYRELLKRTNGLYNHVIYINPGQVVDDLKINVLIKESSTITIIKTPPIRNELLPEGPEGTNKLAVVDRISPTKAFISYEPSPLEQESGISGQFIVQYDVDRNNNAGDLLFMDGYFVHFLAPEGIEPMPMDIMFVLDKSGSMETTKMNQLKESMMKILDDVKAEDKIFIMAFASSLRYWKQEFVQATPENIIASKNYVNNIKSGGGTNIDLALKEGIKRLTQISGNKGRAPVLVFLTDGKGRVRDLKRENEAEIPIFSLAFGRGADFDLVKRVAAQNNGFGRKIYEDSDAALQIAGFYKEISTVLMKNVSFNYIDGTLYDTEVTNTKFSTYFKGSEMVVAGKVKDLNKLQSGLTVNGTGVGNREIEIPVPRMWCTILPWPPRRPMPFTTPTPPVTTRNPSIMEKLWAYLTIKQLLKDKDALDSTNEIKTLNNKIIQLSLKYQFVTPLTSMVVTLPDQTKANPSEVQTSERRRETAAADLAGLSGAMPMAMPKNFPSTPFKRIAKLQLGPPRQIMNFQSIPFNRNAKLQRASPRQMSMIDPQFRGFMPRNHPMARRNPFPTTTRPPVTTRTTTLKTTTTTITSRPIVRKLEKSQIPSFGITLPGLETPLCFDLPMNQSKVYNLMSSSSPAKVFKMNGRSGPEMIDRITVTEDVQTVSYDAQPTDASKTPVFQTLLETTSLVARNTPLGLQFLANFPARNNDINGILALFKDYSGNLVDILIESGEFVAYVNIESSSGTLTVLKATTKEFDDGICYYLDNETLQQFYTNISQFEVTS
uniref:Inter-alpha-trypsin inhibitor heavy chain H4-like isoform X1 n=1 Tax=Crassostrea virginica TaxID=6565 RepID=A0A8B8DQ83_CRAVI|nr:inter-alpha-trypsin inhibitor heavy chain H4-like isoform X1 [Crassostrea virginica]